MAVSTISPVTPFTLVIEKRRVGLVYIIYFLVNYIYIILGCEKGYWVWDMNKSKLKILY